MPTLSVHDKARRLIQFATGEEYGDGTVVTEVIGGFAEPGYGSDESLVVLGDWNPCVVPGIDDPWKSRDPRVTFPGRLARSLERVGAHIAWLDEWTECGGCLRAVRITADSYSWKPYYAICEGDLLCADCLREMGTDALSEYINDSTKAITWCEPAHVESLGFVKYAPGDPHDYENGWYPGQDDDPASILSEILDSDSAAEVVFFIDYTGQFDLGFSAYVRHASEED